MGICENSLKEMLEQDNGENLHKIHNDKALIDIALTTHNKDLRYKIIDRYSLEVFSYIAKQRLGYNISKDYLENYKEEVKSVGTNNFSMIPRTTLLMLLMFLF